MAASGESCPTGGSQQACDCIAELLLSETGAALGQMGVEQKAITKCFQRNCLTMADTKLDLLGSQAPIQSDTSTAAADQADTAAGASDGGCVHGGPAVPQQGIGAGASNNYQPPSEVVAGIAGSFTSHAQQAPSILPGQPPMQVMTQPATTCGCKATLVVSGLRIGVGPGGVPAYLFGPQGFQPSGKHTLSVMQASASRLYSLVLALLSQVFGASLGTNRIFVFYDPDSSSIAFNRGNGQQLWFNAAVTVSSSGFSSEAEARMRFWFLVCAHELAHNTVCGHDSQFSDVSNAIVLQYAKKYEVFLQTAQGSF